MAKLQKQLGSNNQQNTTTHEDSTPDAPTLNEVINKLRSEKNS